MSDSFPPRSKPERAYVDSTSALSWGLREVLLSYDHISRHVAHRMGLSHNELRALEHIMRDPTLGSNGIAQSLGITSASATTLVDRLEGHGHVVRRAHPSDRRRKIVEVTPRAYKQSLEVMRPMFEAMGTLDEDFDAKEKAAIVRYFERILAIHAQFEAGGLTS